MEDFSSSAGAFLCYRTEQFDWNLMPCLYIYTQDKLQFPDINIFNKDHKSSDRNPLEGATYSRLFRGALKKRKVKINQVRQRQINLFALPFAIL